MDLTDLRQLWRVYDKCVLCTEEVVMVRYEYVFARVVRVYDKCVLCTEEVVLVRYEYVSARVVRV